MFEIIALIVVVLIAVVLIYATTKPDTFRVQHSMNIKTQPEKILPLINDFHNWAAWSPWEKMDPLLKRTYSGSGHDQCAVYEGTAIKKRHRAMNIVEKDPPSKVLIKLDFIKPFEGHNIAEFTLEGNGDSTNVTWAICGPPHYMAKVMSLFMDCDNMVGPQFETGLAKMKAVTEENKKGWGTCATSKASSFQSRRSISRPTAAINKRRARFGDSMARSKTMSAWATISRSSSGSRFYDRSRPSQARPFCSPGSCSSRGCSAIASTRKVIKDPRIRAMCDPKSMPFDVERLVYGGFKVLVDA